MYPGLFFKSNPHIFAIFLQILCLALTHKRLEVYTTKIIRLTNFHSFTSFCIFFCIFLYLAFMYHEIKKKASWKSKDAKHPKIPKIPKLKKLPKFYIKDAKAALISDDACFWISRCQNGIIIVHQSQGEIWDILWCCI